MSRARPPLPAAAQTAIWKLASQGQSGGVLDEAGFFVAALLMSMAQSGHEVTTEAFVKMPAINLPLVRLTPKDIAVGAGAGAGTRAGTGTGASGACLCMLYDILYDPFVHAV